MLLNYEFSGLAYGTPACSPSPMLVSSSYPLSEHVTQASLGDSMRWVIEGDRAIAFIDGCAQSEVPLLRQRLERLNVSIGTKQAYRLFTSDDASRLHFPEEISSRARAIIGTKGRKHSPPGVVEQGADSCALDLGGVSVRRISLGLASPSSTAYIIEPDGVIVCDQSCGFFRGKELPAPGTTTDLTRSITVLRELAKNSFATLGLPWAGAITGSLASQHILAVTEVTSDILEDWKAQVGAAEGDAKATLIAQMHADLRSQLFHVPVEFMTSPSVEHQTALEKAWTGVCGALMEPRSSE